MKRISLYIIIVSISLIYYNSNAQNTKPEQVYSISKVRKPAKWYYEQYILWKEEVNKKPKNTNAWQNYIGALDGLLITNDTNYVKGSNLIKEWISLSKRMEKEIPNSYEYALRKCSEEGLSKFSSSPYLLKVYEMDTNRIDIYPYLTLYYDYIQDTCNLKKMINKWYKTNDFSPGLLALNYNELISLEKNAIIFIHGENVYFPKRVLQFVMGIRKDVTLIFGGILNYKVYRDNILKQLKLDAFENDKEDHEHNIGFTEVIIRYIAENVKDRPVYFSSAVTASDYEYIKDSLYSEGLVFKYSTKKYDNIAIMKRNYENIYLMDYIKYDFSNDISQSVVNYANLNYIPSFLTLYEHYQLSGENDKANKIKNTVYTIVNRNENNEGYFKLIKEKIGE